MEQMRIKHNETGRSMVEMLGVLAVVGVLSIGGVAGYRYAVDKMNANEIINEIKKRAVTASQQRVLNQEINLKEYYPNTDVDMIRSVYEVAFEASYQNNEGFFALEVYDIPKGICRQILRSDWSLPVATELNEIVINDGTECNEGIENKILFAFSNTLSGGDELIQKCEKGYYQLADGRCKEDKKCSDPNKFWNSKENQCISCPINGGVISDYGSAMEDSCTKCKDAYLSQNNSDYYCIHCPSGVTCRDKCCGEGQMCKIDSSYPYTAECVSGLGADECLTNADCNNGSETGNYYCKNALGCTQMIGTCESISDKTNKTLKNGKTYTASNKSMSWHAAKNFCTAMGLSLISPDNYCTETEKDNIQNNGGWGTCVGLESDEYQFSFWTINTPSSCSGERVSYSSIGTGDLGYNSYIALCDNTNTLNPSVTTTTTQTQTETVSPEISESISNPEVSVSVSEEGYFDTDRGDFSCSEL